MDFQDTVPTDSPADSRTLEDHAPARTLAVEFTEVDPGLWFTAGEPSQASMVLGSVPAGTSQPARIALMDAVARMFSEVTGAPYHDVMVVAADRSGN